MPVETKRKGILDVKKLNQLIAIGANELGFDTKDKDPNSQYRHDILFGLTKKTSTSDMTIGEKIKVLDHLKSRGFKITSSGTKKKNPPWIRKLLSIWYEMHQDGFVRNNGYASLEAWAVAQLQHLNPAPAKLEWMNEHSSQLIESLKKYQTRCEVRANRTL
jgi:phage gp16-like protein